MDWRRHYNEYPLQFGPAEYLRQVGLTVSGEPIPEAHFRSVVSRLRKLLALQPSDSLLDLCCGNGLITKELASDVEGILGVDFSEPLLEVARRDHQPENVSYKLANVLDLKRDQSFSERGFTKVLMHGALQHFREADLEPLLKNIRTHSTAEVVIVLGFVPDRERRWQFYDSPARKLRYLAQRIRGTDRIGTWWSSEWIRTVCEDQGLRCTFHEIDPMLHAARYRFDARIAYDGKSSRSKAKVSGAMNERMA